MTTLLQDVPSYGDEHRSSYTFEGSGRPRAATVSFRYMAPRSPIYKPAISPPNSPPSLILPPAEIRSSVLSRSLSRLSCSDERLACSAPPMSRVLSTGPFESSNAENNSRLLCEAFESTPEFRLVEDDLDDYYHQPSSSPSFLDGAARYDASAESFSTLFGGTIGDSKMGESVPFSASPVLISCLRNIARTRVADS
jgi:hypothetical protein